MSLEEFLELDYFYLGIDSHSARESSWETRYPGC